MSSMIFFKVVKYIVLTLFSTLYFVSCESCRFNVTNEQGQHDFDFTSLSLSYHHKAQYVNKNVSYSLYISLCKPLQHFRADLCHSALSCVVKETENGSAKYVPNAGNTLLPKMANGRELDVILQSNVECAKSTYSTMIHFVCDKNETMHVITSDDKEQCQFIVKWTTPAACPVVDSALLSSCLLEENNQKFDLRPLRHPLHYKVNSTKWMYEINICGAIRDGHCQSNESNFIAGCKLGDKNTQSKFIGAYPNSSLTFKDKDKSLKLTYFGEDQHTMEIYFFCGDGPTLITPKSSNRKKLVTAFSVYTPLACPSQSVECEDYKNSKKINLLPLGAKNGNIEVVGPGNETFLLNVCAPLLSEAVYLGSNAASLLINGSSVYSLGVARSPPTIGRKSVFLVYKGGDLICGDRQASTRIDFYCSKTNKPPSFLKLGPDCIFHFEWNSSAACPVLGSRGSGCTLSHPTASYVYNFSQVAASPFTVESENNTDLFRINLCSDVTQTCNGVTNAAVCLLRNNKELVIGERGSQKLSYESGAIYFQLQGQECEKGFRSEVSITVICDRLAGSDSKPVFVKKNRCHFYFHWHTREACLPASNSSCDFIDSSGRKFDLTPLRRANANYHVSTNNTVFLLNVCTSLWQGHNETCQANAGVCIWMDEKYKSIGSVNEDTKLFRNEEGDLTLAYGGGALCNRDIPKKNYINSVIVFKCDKNILRGLPSFIGESDCTYNFVWKTVHGCPKLEQDTITIPDELNDLNEPSKQIFFYKRDSASEPSLPTNRVYSQGNCSVLKPNTTNTTVRFDLEQLRGWTFTAFGKDKTAYEISICDSLRDSTCPPNAGVCSSQISYGAANSDLYYANGTLYLNYTKGSPCLPPTYHSTVIEITCCSENCKEGPTFVEELSQCQRRIRFSSKYACENRCVAVTTDSSRAIDLSVLANSTQNYKASSANAVVYINVCRPLVPVSGLMCSSDSLSCIAIPSGSGFINATSLGIQMISPKVHNNQSVMLKYVFGGGCRYEKYSSSSSYTMICNVSAGSGHPQYEGVTNECEYEFKWPTSIVCPDTELIFSNDNCSFVNPQTGGVLDLKPALKAGGFQLNTASRAYLVNLCDTAPSDECDSIICSEQKGSWMSYGQISGSRYNYNLDIITLNMSKGAKCNENSQFSSEIQIKCSHLTASDDADAWTIRESDCRTVLEWRTPLACFTSSHQSVPEKLETGIGTTSVLIAVTLIIFVVVASVFAVRYFLRRSQNRWTENFRFRRRTSTNSSSEIVYTRVGGTEEATLQFSGRPPDQPADTDSDDELLGLT